MSDMKLTDLPQEAVDAFNKHKHDEDGKRIPTNGIEDLAITTAKLAPKIVTTDKMADNAITGDKVLNGSLGAEKFKPGVLATVDMTSANVSFKNYIANGLGLDWDSGLNLIVRKGRANINDVFVDSVSDMNLPIPANSHGLAYLGKDGTLGFAPFKYPTIDSNFIFAYNFNDANPATKVADLTGNGYDLVGNGTLTDIMSEPGHIGMGCSTGANSGLKSTKTVSITGANKYTMIWAGIMRDNGAGIIPLCIGNSNQRYFELIPPSGEKYFWSITDGILGTMQPRIHPIVNKLNVMIVDFDGYYQRFFFNGRMTGKRKLTSTSTALITGNISIGEYVNANYRSVNRNIHCFAGYTTKVYTQKEIADMCAAMGVANQYDVPMASVPNMVDEVAENHIWNMDETTGNTVADTGTKFTNALQGTAVNANIEKSEIGLGMKRRFDGSTSKITLGNYAFKPEYSFFAVVELKSYITAGTLLGNYVASPEKGNILGIDASGYLKSWTTVSKAVGGTRKFPLNKIGIVGYVVDSGGITFYSDTIHGEKILGYVPETSVSQPTVIGNYGNDLAGTLIDGDIHHAFMIHRKLTQLEIKKLFNSIKNKTSKEMKDVVIPADAVSLGCVKSNMSKLVDVSMLPKYGVYKEPFLRGGRFFTGFKHLSTGQMVEIENPFGTTKVMVTVFRKQNPWSEEMTKDEVFTYYSDQARGFIWDKCTNDVLTFWTGSTHVANAGNEWNSDNSIGWFGFLIEKLDNSITDENDLMFQIDV